MSGSDGLVHDSVPYAGRDSFVDATADLVVHAARDGDACLVLAVSTKIDAVRTALGGEACRVGFVDLSVCGRNPARVLPALRSFLEHHRGKRMRAIAEPVHAGLSAAGLAETVVAELVLSRSEFRDWDAWISCLHDAESLQQDALAAVRCGHPGAGQHEHAAEALTAAFAAELPPPPADARCRVADRTTLGELRAFVRCATDTSGLDRERADDLAYAVNEVLTNSICHGEGRADVWMWTDQDTTCCEVRDKGRIHDVLVGRIAPRPGQASGRGLWLVNQLCDLVQVRSSQSGTVVRMLVDL